FQFDYIKIDRSFVSRLTGATQNSGIVKTIVHLAQDMSSKTIAEGIETSSILELLRDLGCDYGQGYYFCTAVHAPAAKHLVLSRPSWQSAASRATASHKFPKRVFIGTTGRHRFDASARNDSFLLDFPCMKRNSHRC